jgi:hypothetical protein
MGSLLSLLDAGPESRALKSDEASEVLMLFLHSCRENDLFIFLRLLVSLLDSPAISAVGRGQQLFFARTGGARPLRRFAEGIVLAFGLHAEISFSSLLMPANSSSLYVRHHWPLNGYE